MYIDRFPNILYMSQGHVISSESPTVVKGDWGSWSRSFLTINLSKELKTRSEQDTISK